MGKVSRIKQQRIERGRKMQLTIRRNKLNENIEASDETNVNRDENFAISPEQLQHKKNDISIGIDSGAKTSNNCSLEYEISAEKEAGITEVSIGRRIVNVSNFSKQLIDLCSSHGPLGCPPSGIIIKGEKKNGLISKFTFHCKLCNSNFVIQNDNIEENYLNLNACAVAGTMAIGCGQSQLEELLSATNLPLINQRLYDKNHQLISKHWEKVSTENMLEAGRKENEIAKAEGKVSQDGYGIIDVIVDGCWSKRSYKKNYAALSGAAAIIGKNTGEILFLGVKNKYCQVCAKAERDKIVTVQDHLCFKNFEGPSTGMENTILVEGFKRSIEQHGLIYGRLISDGDSSTYSKILEARPYPNTTVEKIECRNHVLRNLCNKLQNLATETRYPLKHRKCVTKESIMSIRRAIVKNIRKHKTDSDVHLLFEDLLKCHHHAFGNHFQCMNHFCDKVGEERKKEHKTKNIPDDFFSGALWQKINLIIQGVAAHARSLIHDVDSNRVECFHSVVAKFVGGKRINFSKKNSYTARVHAAAVAFTKKRALSRLYKSINGGKSPGGRINKLEARRIKKVKQNKANRKPRRRLFQREIKNKDYGENCTKPDVDEETFEKLKTDFLLNLKKSDKELQQIEKNTILQSESGEWMEMRRSLLTASNFGRIIKLRDDTSCASIVKELLYKPPINHVASIKHGRDNEKSALTQLSAQLNIKIDQCGLFIDQNLPYLGATPDGMVDNNVVVEVKCPISAKGIGIQNAISQKKITFWKKTKNGEHIINKNHNWFYQVQGQLHITRRSKCIFGVWASENEELKVEIIPRDDCFWNEKIEEKLSRFYKNCLLPELVDPRHPRHLTIRDPVYIQEAVKKKQQKRNRV